MSERKIYPGATPPPRSGDYATYSKTGWRTPLYFDGDEWMNQHQYSLGYTPDYWEELPKFDEQFVVTEKQ